MTTKEEALQAVRAYFAGGVTKADALGAVKDYYQSTNWVYTVSSGGYGSGTGRTLYKNGVNFGTIQIPEEYRDRDREYLIREGLGETVSPESEAAQAAEDAKAKEYKDLVAANNLKQIQDKIKFLNRGTATWVSEQDAANAIISTQAAIDALGTTGAGNTGAGKTGISNKLKLPLAAAAVLALFTAVAYFVLKGGKK